MALFSRTEIPAIAPAEDITSFITTAVVYEGGEATNITPTLRGSPWVLKAYYNQILRKDDSPRQLDLGLDPSVQQYQRTRNLTIGVTTALQTSPDQSTGITDVTGGGEMYPGIAPNIGDMFVAMTDGRIGLFVLTMARRMQYIAYSGFEIEYSLFDFHNNDYEKDLYSKTVRDGIFDVTKAGCDDAISMGMPIVEPGLILRRLVMMYYDEFYDLVTETCLVPAQERTYDPWVARFFRSIVDRELRGEQPLLTIYETPTGEFDDNAKSIWDALIQNNPNNNNRIPWTMTTVSTSIFHSAFTYRSIAYIQVTRVVWPPGKITLHGAGPSELGDTYAFSNHFYEGDLTQMPVHEAMVHEAIRGTKPDTSHLETFVNGLGHRTPLERFYMIPMAIYLLKAYMR